MDADEPLANPRHETYYRERVAGKTLDCLAAHNMQPASHVHPARAQIDVLDAHGACLAPTQAQGGAEQDGGLEGLADNAPQRLALLVGRERRPANGRLP